jgi:hypothetical protein
MALIGVKSITIFGLGPWRFINNMMAANELVSCCGDEAKRKEHENWKAKKKKKKLCRGLGILTSGSHRNGKRKREIWKIDVRYGSRRGKGTKSPRPRKKILSLLRTKVLVASSGFTYFV